MLQHALALFIGGGIGALYDNILAGLLLATLALLAWHVVQLYRLERWVRTGELREPPAGDGAWPRVYARIQFFKDRSSYHRNNWRGLVKELRASAKAFPDAGIILNPHHEIINYNKAARQMLGLKKRRDRGQRVDNLIRHPGFVAYLESGEDGEGVVIPGTAEKDVWLSCRIIPYGPDQRLLLIRDISQSVMLERMRSDFVANASHELRTPLTVVSGYLEVMAEDEQLADNWAGPIADLREQTKRMSLLVSDLLELSRLESSEASSLENEVDIGAILAALAKEVSRMPERPETIDLQLNSKAKLLGENPELQSIASNLIYNAMRYTPNEGRVIIRWDVDDTGGHLSVEDSGIGIAPDDIPRLTERFFRADSGRDRRSGGTGLGLAIVKHALKRHDGNLEIKSVLGQGSTFSCHFPTARLVMDT